VSEPSVLFEKRGDVALLTLNRPKSFNAMDLGLMVDLAAAAARCRAEGARAVVVTGAGRAFSAGGDLSAFARSDDAPALLRRMTDELHHAQRLLAEGEAPVVAAVNGMAAGAGMSLAAMCDLAIAGRSAKFTMAYTGAGLSPDGSSTWFLPRLIGLRRTQELMFTNRVLDAEEALEWQVVHRVVDDERVLDEALELAGRLAAGPTRAYAAVKRLLLASAGRDLEEQLDLEGKLISGLSGSADGQEGIRAFLEKRKPVFEGR